MILKYGEEIGTMIPKSIWSGEIDVAGYKLKVHVLNDGRRIIEADSLKNFLDSSCATPSELDELIAFCSETGIPKKDAK
jgi:hypothetical protein